MTKIDKLYVVVLDDDDLYLEWLIVTIGTVADTVVGFTSPHEAINSMIENPPSLLVLDINMPTVDGVALCDIIRKNKALQDLPIVLISGNPNIGDFSLYFKGVDFVQKSFQMEELLNKVKLYAGIGATQSAISKILRALEKK